MWASFGSCWWSSWWSAFLWWSTRRLVVAWPKPVNHNALLSPEKGKTVAVLELSSSGESLVIGIVNAFGPLSQLTSQLFHQMDKFINLDFSAWGKGGRELCDLKTSYPVCCFVLSTLLEQFLNIFLEFEIFLFHPLAFSSQFQLYMFIYDMKCFSLSGDWCCGS